ncbi:MAG: prolipoprotein diacylglyceryl transferase [Myxococcota bacterium]
MHPILFDVNGFEIHSYGFMGALGFLFTAFTALQRGKALNVKPERMADLMFFTALLALAGARLVFILQNPGVFSTWGEWVNLRTGGLVFYGAILVGVPVGSLLIWRYGMPFFATWDIFGAAFPVAHGLSRIGCFLAGCCYGAHTTGPTAVIFTDPRSVAPLNTPVHPTQLYEAFFLFALGIGVNLLYYRKAFDGQVMLVYLLCYALGRSIIESFRGDESRGYFLPDLLGELLTYSQGFSIVMAAIAVVVFGVVARRVSATRTPASE